MKNEAPKIGFTLEKIEIITPPLSIIILSPLEEKSHDSNHKFCCLQKISIWIS